MNVFDVEPEPRDAALVSLEFALAALKRCEGILDAKKSAISSPATSEELIRTSMAVLEKAQAIHSRIGQLAPTSSL